MDRERLRMLHDMPIFGGVKDEILELMLKDTVVVSIAKGDFLFRENDRADSMFVIETGKVAILKLVENTQYRIRELGAGDCVGEMCLIDLGRRSASVLALTDCTAIELPATSFLDLYQRDLEQFALIQTNMSRELSRRLRTANDRLFLELIKNDLIPRH